MTKAEARSLITNRLGQRIAVDGLVDEELRAAQVFMESREEIPWFLATTSTVVTSSSVNALPAGFIMELPEEPLVRLVGAEAITPLIKRGMWEVDALRLGKGEPKYYVLEPTTYTLVPSPESSVTLELRYYAADTSIASIPDSGTTKWLTYAPLVLVNLAGFRVASHLRSPESATLFQSGVQEALSAMWRKHYAMAQNARGVGLGGYNAD